MKHFFALFAILVAIVYASCVNVPQLVYDGPIYELSEYYFFHVHFNHRECVKRLKCSSSSIKLFIVKRGEK